MEVTFESVIIGSGPAGISCAMGLLEAHRPAALIDKNLNCGGQLPDIPSPIPNFAGTYWQNGKEAQRDMQESLDQARKIADFDGALTLMQQSEVVDFKPDGTLQIANAQGVHTIRARFILLAPGYRVKRLSFAGSPQAQKHVFYRSSTASIEDMAGATAVVVGGGDSAVLEALSLVGRCKKIILLSRSTFDKARPDLRERLALSSIESYQNSQIAELLSDSKSLTGLTLKDNKTGERQDMSCNFVVIKAGYEPNTEFLKGTVDLDESGHIKVDSHLNVSVSGTSVQNIFAAGDAAVSPISCPRIAMAVGQGMAVASRIALLAQSK